MTEPAEPDPFLTTPMKAYKGLREIQSVVSTGLTGRPIWGAPYTLPELYVMAGIAAVGLAFMLVYFAFGDMNGVVISCTGFIGLVLGSRFVVQYALRLEPSLKLRMRGWRKAKFKEVRHTTRPGLGQGRVLYTTNEAVFLASLSGGKHRTKGGGNAGRG